MVHLWCLMSLSIFLLPLTQGSVPNKFCNFEKISFENAVNVRRVGFVAYKTKKEANFSLNCYDCFNFVCLICH